MRMAGLLPCRLFRTILASFSYWCFCNSLIRHYNASCRQALYLPLHRSGSQYCSTELNIYRGSLSNSCKNAVMLDSHDYRSKWSLAWFALPLEGFALAGVSLGLVNKLLSGLWIVHSGLWTYSAIGIHRCMRRTAMSWTLCRLQNFSTHKVCCTVMGGFKGNIAACASG